MRRLLLIALVACSGSSPSTSRPAAPAPAPTLLGRPVWDGPLTDVSARRLVDRVNATLADPPPALHGTDPRAWAEPFKSWIQRRADAGREIRRDADALIATGDPRLQLLAAIALGVAGNDLVTDMIGIELPAEVRDGEFGADIEQVFRQTVEGNAVPVAVLARQALEKCAELAPQALALSAWTVFCRKRADSLAALEKRVAERQRAPSTGTSKQHEQEAALIADCTSGDVLHVDPDALPPDRKAKPAVAYIYDGDELKGPDALALEAAVAKKLRGSVKMPVVDARELAAARGLVAQKKLHAKAPVCGQAPPLPAVVAHKRRHLIVGEISTTCIADTHTNGCGVLVEYKRAGDDNQDDVPRPMFAPVTKREAPASEWIAAASSLAPSEGRAWILGALATGDSDPVLFNVSGYSDEDPWLRVAGTLRGETMAKLASCVDAPASFDATIAISREGKTTAVTLAPVTAPAAGTKVADCVKQAIEATPWPCTRDGKPGTVAIRMCVAPRPSR